MTKSSDQLLVEHSCSNISHQIGVIAQIRYSYKKIAAKINNRLISGTLIVSE